MGPSRRLTNGRSPLVNQQRQITSFFSKSSSSSSPITPNQNPTKLSSSGNPKPKPKPSRSPSLSPSPSTPSPLQSKLKKPLLVIGASPSSPLTLPPSEKFRSEEAVGKRIKVYWPLDKSWYEGSVKSFDGDSGKHLVEYDDGEEESIELAKEKIEWIEQSVRKFKRLRKGPSLSVEKMVIDDDDEDEAENLEDSGDDSSDEDWGKSAEKEGIEEDCEEKEVVELEDEDEEDEPVRTRGKRGGKGETRKRKTSGEGNVGSAKKNMGREGVSKDGLKVSFMEPTNNNADRGKASDAINTTFFGDASERFSMREATKLRFLGESRRDAKRRRPGDPDYDPRTLYLPPDFIKSLSDGQWEFKSKHMDKVLFFKMGKFYELFEMDAHTGAKELDLQYMKVGTCEFSNHSSFPASLLSPACISLLSFIFRLIFYLVV